MTSKLHGHQPTKVAGEAYADEVRAKVATESQNTVKKVKTSTMPSEVEGSQNI